MIEASKDGPSSSHPTRAYLLGYLETEDLHGPVAEAFPDSPLVAHLRGCSGCQQRLATVRSERSAVAELARDLAREASRGRAPKRAAGVAARVQALLHWRPRALTAGVFAL